MRRMQVIEAMNYAEKRGWTYALGYNPEIQYQMTFATVGECMEIIGFLEERGMSIDEGKIAPSGQTLL